MKENKQSKKYLALIIGIVLIVVAFGLLGIACACNVLPWNDVASNGGTWGFGSGIGRFFAAFVPDPGLINPQNSGPVWWPATMSVGGLVGVVVTIVALVLCVVHIVVCVRKGIKNKIADAVVLFVGTFFAACLGCVLINGLLDKTMWRCSEFWLLLSFLIVVIASLFVGYDLAIGIIKANVASEEKPAVEAKPVFDEEACRRVADDEIQKHAEATADCVTEDRVHEIIDGAIEKHVEDMHTEYVDEETPAAPAQEPKAEEEPVEEKKEEAPVEEEKEEEAPAAAPVEEEKPTEEAAVEGDRFSGFGEIRRVPFEEKLENADEDLRKKYEGLRDYILAYGIKNRISIPGDTFSAHRERYVFITIAGKRLKVYFALNPDNYADSTIPVERIESKKFEDLPLCLKIKSDLSWRRACQLVDDVMAAKGVAKPEEEQK